MVCLHQLLVDLHLHSKDCFGNAVFARVKVHMLKRLARFPSTFKRCCLTLFFHTFPTFTLDCYWNIAVSRHGTGNLRQELGTVCRFHSLTFRCHTEKEARTRQCFAETVPIGNIHWPEFEERVLQPDVIYWRHERRSRAPHFSVIVLLPSLNQNSGKPILFHVWLHILRTNKKKNENFSKRWWYQVETLRSGNRFCIFECKY